MTLKKIEVEFNTIGDFGKDLRFYDAENKEIAAYWTDNKRVYWRDFIIKNADINSFVAFNKVFAKDKNHCYLQGRLLKKADPKSFEVMNYCYAKDNENVWTISGLIKGIDIKTFEICDDGIRKGRNDFIREEFSDGVMREKKVIIPYGYAKDKDNVYYEDFQGKTKIVKKANPKTFKSLNNGYYGLDDTYVFYKQFVIQKANPNYWSLIDETINLEYSKDNKSVFSFNKKINNIDIETFELIKVEVKLYGKSDETENKKYFVCYGKDKNSYYDGTEKKRLEEITKDCT